ncbi:MAG: MarR family transcriptional regulator [Pirellulaceae bacterium]|nr:MarR family transcriptional regulator [Pirellulaceae bacterium]
MTLFTETQGRYLSFIHAYTEAFGQAPSMSEIGDTLKVSVPSVNNMLKSLEQKGLIERQPKTARSIEVLVDPELLPKWKKKLSSGFSFWAQNNASKEDLDRIMDQIISQRKERRELSKHTTQTQEASTKGAEVLVYRLNIQLDEFKPKIWRLIETLDLNLFELAAVIEAAMGWQSYHLHQFTIKGKQYADLEMMGETEDYHNEADYRLSDLVPTKRPTLKMKFLYDFGDGWSHTVSLEQVETSTAPASEFPRCLDGKHSCPPEDVGGVWGFADFLAAISDPEHEEHYEMSEWAGKYNFEKFDPLRTTRAMKNNLVRVVRESRKNRSRTGR